MSRFRDLRANCSGTAAVELAIVAPLFILLVFGMVVHGTWFSLAQSVQSLATESARASIGGLDAVERRSLALAYITAQAPASGLEAGRVSQTVEVSDTVTRVTVRLDLEGHPVMTLGPVIPSPPRVIERSAVILSSRP
jgi:Flp pilus assembly protein TadG